MLPARRRVACPAIRTSVHKKNAPSPTGSRERRGGPIRRLRRQRLHERRPGSRPRRGGVRRQRGQLEQRFGRRFQRQFQRRRRRRFPSFGRGKLLGRQRLVPSAAQPGIVRAAGRRRGRWARVRNRSLQGARPPGRSPRRAGARISVRLRDQRRRLRRHGHEMGNDPAGRRRRHRVQLDRRLHERGGRLLLLRGPGHRERQPRRPVHGPERRHHSRGAREGRGLPGHGAHPRLRVRQLRPQHRVGHGDERRRRVPGRRPVVPRQERLDPGQRGRQVPGRSGLRQDARVRVRERRHPHDDGQPRVRGERHDEGQRVLQLRHGHEDLRRVQRRNQPRRAGRVRELPAGQLRFGRRPRVLRPRQRAELLGRHASGDLSRTIAARARSPGTTS